MLRVSSTNALVIPPFECAWLNSDEDNLKEDSGCIEFEARGLNDVTVMLKDQPGSRRWQDLSLSASTSAPGADARVRSHDAGPPAARPRQAEQSYVVIIGSHRNRKVKIERNGAEMCTHRVTPDVSPTKTGWRKFWVDVAHGTITVGAGHPGTHVLCQWSDPEPVQGLRYVGLATWDAHVAYRKVTVGPSINALLADGREGRAPPSALQLRPDGAAPPPHVPSLFSLAAAAVARGLAPDSACLVAALAEAMGHVAQPLIAACVDVMARDLPACISADPAAFAALPCGALCDVISHPALDLPELAVFDAVQMWAAGCGRHTPLNTPPLRPMPEIEAAMRLVRFPMMSEDELGDIAARPITRHVPLLQRLLAEAVWSTREALIESGAARSSSGPCSARTSLDSLDGALPQDGAPLPRRAFEVEGKRLVRHGADPAAQLRHQRRVAGRAVELMYVHDGDGCGLFAHVSTNGGTEPWVNPVTTGRLAVTASSPATRFTRVNDFATGKLLKNSYAGPRIVKTETGRFMEAWWAVDLGPSARLLCNYYTLRHDGSDVFLRNWELQGSEDGVAWTTLRLHAGDGTLRERGQRASWPVSVPAGECRPLRHFRVCMRAQAQDGSLGPGNMELHLSHMELYGYLLS
ncbi:unnamed protein product [Pedinophyceae sp. YPF-701]|nr:unnamed protein product [Pedinophyceae sp. YPF-701]